MGRLRYLRPLQIQRFGWRMGARRAAGHSRLLGGRAGLRQVDFRTDRKAIPAAFRGGMGVRRQGGKEGTNYSFPDTDINEYAWSARNANGPQRVGTRKTNPFGLKDMNGNVAEWVEDCFHENYREAPLAETAWTTGPTCSRRVVRGGSWLSDVKALRSASRDWHPINDDSSDLIGFRLARDFTADEFPEKPE
jgi:hypothetical protein